MSKSTEKKSNKKLSNKQEAFCQEYVLTLNATQSAITAGYSKKTADRIGSENLGKLGIIKRITEIKEKTRDKTKLTIEEVVLGIKEDVESARELGDLSVALKGRDMLMKHLGGYEKDNKRDVEVTVKASLSDFYKDIGAINENTTNDNP